METNGKGGMADEFTPVEPDKPSPLHGPAEGQERSAAEQGLAETHRANDSRQISKRRAGGPRTKRGKAVSSRNATKFGFFSRYLPIESASFKGSRREFRQLLKDLTDDWEPVGCTESLMVETIAYYFYLLRQFLLVREALICGRSRLESSTLRVSTLRSVFAREAEAQRPENRKAAAELASLSREDRDKMRLMMARIDEKLKEVKKMSAEELKSLLPEADPSILEWLQKGPKIPTAQLQIEIPSVEELKCLLPPPSELESLQKAESHILRHLYRAISELERLQLMRGVLPGVVLDVNKN